MRIDNRLNKYLAKLADRWASRLLLTVWLGFGLPVVHETARADNALEYQVKAAFIYNFIAFTQWPSDADSEVNLCLYGEDYFGHEIDKLQNKAVGTRSLKVSRISNPEQLAQCQAIFFAKSVNNDLAELMRDLSDKPILTLADSPNATSKGIAINMNLVNEKVVFEINLGIARKAGLDISSKLLQLAAKVYQ
ncbi:YfiR family protein [Nitrosomonas sp. wSCUT-2]